MQMATTILLVFPGIMHSIVILILLLPCQIKKHKNYHFAFFAIFTSYKWKVTSYKLQVEGYKLQVESGKLQMALVTNCKLHMAQVRTYKLQFAQVTSYKWHKLQVTTRNDTFLTWLLLFQLHLKLLYFFLYKYRKYIKLLTIQKLYLSNSKHAVINQAIVQSFGYSR